MKLQYCGTRALLLGGSCEIGLTLAGAMMTSGIHPMLTYRNEQGRERIHEKLRTHGMDYDTVFLDLKASGTNNGLDAYLHQGLDYLVDMAQGDLEGLVPAVDSQAIGDFFDTDIKGRTILVQLVARAMLAGKKGRMVYISSTAADRPNPGQGFYAAAKQSAEAIYRNLGLELAGRGVTTAILRPGYLDAGRGRRYLKQHTSQALAKVPLGRVLTIQEVVDTIMFLISESAAGFNATVLTMDGGLSAGK